MGAIAEKRIVSTADLDRLIARTEDAGLKHFLVVGRPLTQSTIVASETAPNLIVAEALGVLRPLGRAVDRRINAAEEAAVTKRERDIEVRRAAAMLVAQQFIEINGLADVFRIRKKKLSLEFLVKRVAEEILFAASYPSRQGNRLTILPKREDSADKFALTEAAFREQEKINKHFLNNKRNVCSDAGRIEFYVHDLFSLIQRNSPTNRIPLSVSEEVMSEWKTRWWGFSDVNPSRKLTRAALEAVLPAKQ